MPLLQGQPFKLIKPPDNIEPETEIFVIQHTGEKFVNKSDYEDRLALYSQSIWSCQCTGKSGLTHQEAWTSEAKVRVLLSSSFAEALLPPILTSIHHSTLPLDQLIESAINLCYTKYHPGEELTFIGHKSYAVRIIRSREDPNATHKAENGSAASPSETPSTPVINGCSSMGGGETPIVNGSSNGTGEETSPTHLNNDQSPSSPGSSPTHNTRDPSTPHNNGTRGKEESPLSKKSKVPSLLPLLYDITILEEDRVEKDVPANLLLRTYKVPPKEHFRLLVRASAMRHRSSSYTPWLVSDDLVKQYNIPSKLASIFTSPKVQQATGKKRKSDAPNEERKKKAKPDKPESTKPHEGEGIPKLPGKPGRKPKEKRDPDSPRKKPGPKPGSKRIKKILPAPGGTDVKTVTISSDSDDEVSLAVLAKQPKLDNGLPDMSSDPNVMAVVAAVSAAAAAASSPNKRKIIKPYKVFPKKLKQPTLFDLKSPSKRASITSLSPSKSSPSRGRKPTAEAVMRSPTMRSLMSKYNKHKGNLKKIYHQLKMAVKRLSLPQMEVVPIPEVRDALLRRHIATMQNKMSVGMAPEEKHKFLKDTRRQIREYDGKTEDRLLDLKPLPEPTLVPTPDEIPNSLFGDIAMVVEFVECYQDLVKLDKKFQISHSQLTQALAAGPRGFKYVAQIMCMLLQLIFTDEDITNTKELGTKLGSLPVHYETAMELTRLCLKRPVLDENNDESEGHLEVAEKLLDKMEHTELYELSPTEVLEILRALCHRVMDLDITMDHMEELEEKANFSAREERRHRKEMGVKRKEGPRKQPGRKPNVVTIDKFYKKDRLKRNKGEKDPATTENSKEDGKKDEEEKAEGGDENKNGTEKPEYAEEKSVERERTSARIRNKRRNPVELKKEKDAKEEAFRRKLEEEAEVKHKLKIIKDCRLLKRRFSLMLRIKPLGSDRNHDRYWLFNSTTPGLFVEKGWVHPDSTYCTKKSSINRSPTKYHGPVDSDSDSDSDNKPLSSIKRDPKVSARKNLEPALTEQESIMRDIEAIKNNIIDPSLTLDNKPLTALKTEHPDTSDSDDKPLATIKEELGGSSDSDRPLAAIKQSIKEGSDSDDKPLSTIKKEIMITPRKIPDHSSLEGPRETFPPIGQNLWFCYNSMEEVQKLQKALHTRGTRESRLNTAISNVKEELAESFAKVWEPMELEDGALAMTEALREDILQIEKELSEGMLGAVPDMEQWRSKTEQATTLQELGECLVEAQRHMHKKNLKGIMNCAKTIFIVQIDNPDECDLVEPASVTYWRDAVLSCLTFSRMHMLVGLFDSCIKWEKSVATMKCKVCRQQGNNESPLAICEKCDVSYHWRCLRPPLRDAPPDPWHCPSCIPSNKAKRTDRHISLEDDEEKEKVCRVCYRGLGLIFCCRCPAAYHSECHDPPLTSRARKDWECVDCTKRKRMKKGRGSGGRNRRNRIAPEDDLDDFTDSIKKYKGRPEDDEEDVDFIIKGYKKACPPASAKSKSTSKSKSKKASKKKKKKPESIRPVRRSSRRICDSSDEEDDQEDEEQPKYSRTPQRQSSRSTRGRKNYSLVGSSEEEEEEEEEEQEQEQKEEEEEEQVEEEEEQVEEEEEEQEEGDEQKEDDEEEEENVEEEEEEEEEDDEEEEEGNAAEQQDDEEEEEGEEEADEGKEEEEEGEDDREGEEDNGEDEDVDDKEEEEEEEDMEEGEEKDDRDEDQEEEEEEEEDSAEDMEGVEEDKEEEEEQGEEEEESGDDDDDDDDDDD